MNQVSILAAAALAAALPAQAPQHLVVPAAAASSDANSFEWLAGASAPLRQLNLGAASRLSARGGRPRTAGEWR
ncbi:MAG: hypothetical protein ACK595_00745, partial [Planctomycetota bacterium]